MRIGIDGSSILPQRTGIGHYTAQLLRHLARIDNENEYAVFLNSMRHAPAHEPWMDRPNFEVRRGRFPGPGLLYLWRWFNRPPIDRLVGPVDVFHSPASYVPPQRYGAGVTTIHDLYFMRDPGVCDWLGGRFLKATLPKRLPGVKRIIAASRHTRDDLVNLLDVPEDRIHIVYEGVDADFGRVEDPAEIAAVRKRYSLPGRYILFVGTIEPRKNLVRLIEGYARARGAMSDLPPLVIAGGTGTDTARVQEAIDRLRLGKAVRRIGYVAHADLPAIYTMCELFVLPSLYEGFGLPVLEAMKCRVPVVAADTSSLRELVVGRGYLVDPMNPEDIASGIARALTNRNESAEYIREGWEFAAQMTWERCARRTLDVYNIAAAESRLWE